MIIRQLSMFLENKPGRLMAALEVLNGNGVNISALSLADSEEYGVLRLIVDNPDKAKEVLTDSGITVSIGKVFAVAMDDTPGGALSVIRLLAESKISIEYMYACVGNVSGKALMIVKTEGDQSVAEKVLTDGGFGNVSPADIYRI